MDKVWIYSLAVLCIILYQLLFFPVKVNYVDYGNEETLPLSELQPLHSQFRILPSQAIQCCLANVLPFSLSTAVWSNHICDWFSSLLLGTTIEVSICESSLNQVSLEIILPREQLMKSILLNVTRHNDCLDKHSTVPLSLFMNSICLSTRPCDMIERAISHISALPPLVIRFNASREFTCLMSSVADKMHFYVHPVQEDLAHTMNLINDVLSNHYTHELNRIHFSPESIKYGNVCCIHSAELNHWCRGVITSIKTDLSGGPLTCSVFLLDYGVSEWVESSDVFILVKPLCEYPSQVVCCCFEEISADCAGEVLLSPDINGVSSNTYKCLITQGKILSECAHFMRAATDEKQLFVVVKQNGK